MDNKPEFKEKSLSFAKEASTNEKQDKDVSSNPKDSNARSVARQLEESLKDSSNKHSQKDVSLGWLVRNLALFIAIALMIRVSCVEAFKIPSSSMLPTLEIGDQLLVNKLSYGLWLPFLEQNVISFADPKQGDIVVFTLPDDDLTPEVNESNTNIIKRVIGLAGDEVEVRGTKVIVNGKVILDPWGKWREGGVKNFPRSKVPDGHVFVLGDNRDQSKDARFWTYPFLSIKRIKGRAIIIYWNAQLKLHRMFKLL